MTRYEHKSGGVYRARRRVAYRSPLYAGDQVSVDLGYGVTLENVLVTDDIGPSEDAVLYTSVNLTPRSYLRPARLFDDPTRFKELPHDPDPR